MRFLSPISAGHQQSTPHIVDWRPSMANGAAVLRDNEMCPGCQGKLKIRIYADDVNFLSHSLCPHPPFCPSRNSCHPQCSTVDNASHWRNGALSSEVIQAT